MEQKKFRHELKYGIGYLQYLELRNRLRAVMRTDANTNVDGRYLVRSVYFDNYEDKALREKINGISEREKFRIRYYNDDLSYIVLEKKIKDQEIGRGDHGRGMPAIMEGQFGVDENTSFAAGTGIICQNALSDIASKSARILCAGTLYLFRRQCKDYFRFPHPHHIVPQRFSGRQGGGHRYR